MFSFIMITLVTLGSAVFFGQLFKEARERRQEREALERQLEEEERGVLKYKSSPYVVSDTFTDGATIDYLGFLSEVKDYGKLSDVKEALDELRTQERRINFLYDQIVPLVRRLKMERPKFTFAVLQRCFDAYSDNRREVVSVVESLWSSKLKSNQEEYKAMIIDIAKDNRVILASLDKFYTAMSEYLAKVNDDETSIHVTDLASAAELDKLTEIFENVIQQTEEEIEEQLKKERDGDIMTYVERYQKAYSAAPPAEGASFEERMKQAGAVQLGGGH